MISRRPEPKGSMPTCFQIVGHDQQRLAIPVKTETTSSITTKLIHRYPSVVVVVASLLLVILFCQTIPCRSVPFVVIIHREEKIEPFWPLLSSTASSSSSSSTQPLVSSSSSSSVLILQAFTNRTVGRNMDGCIQKYQNLLDDLKRQLLSKTSSLQTDEDRRAYISTNGGTYDALMKYVVIKNATPKGLATFIVHGGEVSTDTCSSNSSSDPSDIQHRQHLVDNVLLGDTKMLSEVLIADGPKGNKYGRFLHILDAIRQEQQDQPEQQNEHPVLIRLAIAVALEHAEPVVQTNPEQFKNDEDKFVDPVARYLNYEMAYLDGNLDPSFGSLPTWELRFVVDGDEPDSTARWGRYMLQNFRPDHILTSNLDWRYVMLVRSDVRYGSGDVKYDRPELQKYQNILMNGGVCGRRAFIGRFILRAFGIPTAARPSRGHGALCHLNPTTGEWVVNLGPAFGKGWTKTVYHEDLDFQATARARRYDPTKFRSTVTQCQWLGAVFDEKPIYGTHGDAYKKNATSSPWYKLSLSFQQEMIDRKKPGQVPATCPPNPIETIAQDIEKIPFAGNAKRVTVDPSTGRIIIPAASFENPRKTKNVHVMKSFSLDSNNKAGYQIYLPMFKAQGIGVLKGGAWKSDLSGIYSGWRIKSGGYGKYEDWGFRVAIGLGDDDGSGNRKQEFSLQIPDTDHSIEFIYIAPGSFEMGGEGTKDGRFECIEVPRHDVKLTHGYYIGKYPVTQAQYEAAMGSNPSKSTRQPDCPVDNIGENDAIAFCDKLTEVAGRDVRLPTEAEWEYACRAGTRTKWFFGDDGSALGDYAWYKANSGGKSHPVGSKKPNPWGLYDMYGQVLERCSDKYDKDYFKSTEAKVDPTGPSAGILSLMEFKVESPNGGDYKFAGEIVTMNTKQRLMVAVNTSLPNKDSAPDGGICVDMPFTVGEWKEFDNGPILHLKKGVNKIWIWRDNPPQYGLAVKEFTLTPV